MAEWIVEAETLNEVINGRFSISTNPLIRCRECVHFAGEGMYCDNDILVQYDHFYCYYADREEGEG